MLAVLEQAVGDGIGHAGWLNMDAVNTDQAIMTLFSPVGRENPYPLYDVLRETAPVVKSPFGPHLITRYDTADKVLRSSAFRTPRGYRDANDPSGPPMFDPNGKLSLHRRYWLLFQSGDSHTRLRKLIMHVFTPRAIRSLTPRIESLVDELLVPVFERGSLEVIKDLAYPLPATVICELLGIPAADRDRNREWTNLLAATVDPMMQTPAAIAKAEHAMVEWDTYIRDLLAEKRKRPGEALLDAMLAAEVEGQRLTEDEIAANAVFLFLAGHETTTNLIGNGLLALLRHPDQLAKLRGEPALIDNAVEELLRFDSPVQFAPRVPLEPIEIEGVTLPVEVVVTLMLGSANRDPRKFERPNELDITRPDVKPLSFGGGPHYCVGAALARAEAKAALGALATRSRELGLVTEKLAYRPMLTLRGLAELQVTVQR
jgi:cytochrome P450